MKILLLGCGGLGSEILKDLVMLNETNSVIHSITVIDLDTIELTNLNRQLLFQDKDIGQYKSITAAKYLNERLSKLQPEVSPVEIVPVVQDILTTDFSFINQFDICIGALDSIEPRRHVNQLICQLAHDTQFERVIPFWDCGSEGLSGQVKLIIPGFTACWECSSSTLLNDNVSNIPICTIINQPRNMNHIVQFFLEHDVECNVDELEMYENCIQRAKQFNIDHSGFSVSAMKDVINRTVPSVITTNSIISSECCSKIVQFMENFPTQDMFTNNFITINGNFKQYQYYFQFARITNCHVCSILFQ